MHRARPGALCLAAVLWAVVATGTPAQETPRLDVRDVLERLDILGLGAEQVAALRAALREPETLNRLLDHLEERPFLNGILAPLNLDFSNLTAADSSVLALTYDWRKDLLFRSMEAGAHTVYGYHLTAAARGVLTQRADRNPRDLIVSGFSLNGFTSWGGVVAAPRALQLRLNQLEDQMAEAGSLAELEASPEYREFTRSLWGRLRPQTYLTLGLAGALEANQSWDRRQYVAGAVLGFDLKVWNPESRAAAWNVVDWPAALLRYLLGSDVRVRPSGVAIPTLVLGVDRVDPANDSLRVALGEADPFYRFTAAVSYKSALAPLPGGQLYLEAALRYYREFAPAAVVEGAGLDASTYFTVSIAAPNGLYVAYSDGRLPLDEVHREVYELGFRISF
jgi:hypothetical protein